MQTVAQNIAIAQEARYKIFNTYTLPKEAWVEDYYDVLEPRAKSLVDHPNSAVRDFAAETIKEIETFRISEDTYGYVFYILQPKSLISSEQPAYETNDPHTYLDSATSERHSDGRMTYVAVLLPFSEPQDWR